MSAPAQVPPPARPPPTAPPSAAPAPAPPPPDLPQRTKEIRDKLLQGIPGAKLDYARPRRIKVTVPHDSVKASAIFLRDSIGFDHCTLVGGTDYPATNDIEVVYFVGSPLAQGMGDLVVLLAERVPRDAAEVNTLCEVWPGAEFHERETFEMLGVHFRGHPDLRRLLLPEDWNDLPPLRKNYVSPGR